MEVRGVIIGYRKGRGKQYTRQVLVKLEGSISMAYSIVGGKALFTDVKGNIYRGRVLRLHGRRNSVVVVRFRRNIPGQAIGSYVKVYK